MNNCKFCDSQLTSEDGKPVHFCDNHCYLLHMDSIHKFVSDALAMLRVRYPFVPKVMSEEDLILWEIEKSVRARVMDSKIKYQRYDLCEETIDEALIAVSKMDTSWCSKGY